MGKPATAVAGRQSGRSRVRFSGRHQFRNSLLKRRVLAVGFPRPNIPSLDVLKGKVFWSIAPSGRGLEWTRGTKNLLDRVYHSRPARRLRPAALVGAGGNDPHWSSKLVDSVPE